MSGTISICMQQQVDRNGNPLVGGLLYMYFAGTTTPQNGFRDAALVTPYSNPIQLDASGRIPSIFFADGVIRIRLTDASGVLQFDADNLPVIGSASGGGGVDTTDVNALYNTGDIKVRYGTGTLTGYVRCNARTIGSATSGATERAQADCQALFEFLWNNDAALTVLPSRGASANADWLANKQIATPDFRGCAIAGLDDMGSSAAGRLTAAFFGVAATVLGALGGSQSHKLVTAETPTHNHPLTDPGHFHGLAAAEGGAYVASAFLGSASTNIGAGSGGINVAQTGANARMSKATSGITLGPIGGDGFHKNVQPTRLITVYIRL